MEIFHKNRLSKLRFWTYLREEEEEEEKMKAEVEISFKDLDENRPHHKSWYSPHDWISDDGNTFNFFEIGSNLLHIVM